MGLSNTLTSNVVTTTSIYALSGKSNTIRLFNDNENYELKYNEIIKGLNIVIEGDNNIITIGEGCEFFNSRIVIRNSNVKIEIGSKNRIRNTLIRCCFGDEQHFKIGNSNVINGADFYLDEKSSCIIGNKNLFSTEIRVWCSDGHSIMNIYTNDIINNHSTGVMISDHCWIGQGVHITKNCQLPNNTIIGIGSVVTKKFIDENTIIAGNPAKVIKSNIKWDARNTYFLGRDKINHIKKDTAMKYLIVGAGFWGATIAERIATVMKEPVTVIDKRSHIGGNCHSSLDEETGIECHRYGSHIFHTSLPEVWEYINKFGEFTSYQHKVFITYKGKVYTMPINLSTINAYYGKNFRPAEAAAFLEGEIARDFIAEPKNLEEKAISLIGRPLYEAFIKGYTHKQWEHDPRELPASIISRLPFRTTYNANYFNDTWQGVPKDGYFSIFKRMLDNPLITVKLNCEYESIKSQIPSDCTVIYTGMPDQLFQYKYGELEWRSLRFEWETLPLQDYQGTTVMNYADVEVPFTRLHEFKHYHPERKEPFALNKTVICREYSKTYKKGDEAYYPVNNARNNEMYAKYAEEAAKTPNLILGGRLGAYRYWDMDKAIADALKVFETKILKK